MFFLQTGGGLGNQLFSFAFAHYLVDYLQNQGQLFYVIDSKTPRDRNIEIIELVSKCNHNLSIKERADLSLLFKIRDKIHLSSKFISSSLDRFLNIYTYTPDFSNIKVPLNSKIIRGSFINSKVLNLLSLNILDEIRQFISEKNEIKLLSGVSNWQTIHIRRGDLLNFKEPRTLDLRNGLKLISKDLPLVICTDDSNLKKYLLNLYPDCIFLDPLNSSPWEALSAMAGARRLIAANSTLSWWACVLARRNNAEVFGPDCWLEENLYLSDISYYKTVYSSL